MGVRWAGGLLSTQPEGQSVPGERGWGGCRLRQAMLVAAAALRRQHLGLAPSPDRASCFAGDRALCLSLVPANTGECALRNTGILQGARRPSLAPRTAPDILHR